jgi:hypothetical protein
MDMNNPRSHAKCCREHKKTGLAKVPALSTPIEMALGLTEEGYDSNTSN